MKLSEFIAIMFLGALVGLVIFIVYMHITL